VHVRLVRASGGQRDFDGLVGPAVRGRVRRTVGPEDEQVEVDGVVRIDLRDVDAQQGRVGPTSAGSKIWSGSCSIVSVATVAGVRP
jgi:hypothetical protein